MSCARGGACRDPVVRSPAARTMTSVERWFTWFEGEWRRILKRRRQPGTRDLILRHLCIAKRRAGGKAISASVIVRNQYVNSSITRHEASVRQVAALICVGYSSLPHGSGSSAVPSSCHRPCGCARPGARQGTSHSRRHQGVSCGSRAAHHPYPAARLFPRQGTGNRARLVAIRSRSLTRSPAQGDRRSGRVEGANPTTRA
jgi:hypothetical protein